MDWTASAAQPVTASTLLSVAQQQRQSHRGESAAKRVRTGYHPIDETVLEGSYVPSASPSEGIVVGIAAERADGAALSTLLLHKTLATHTTSTSSPQAFVVDPSGALDVLLLHRLVRHACTTSPRSTATSTDEAINAATTRTLDAISILRVLDMEGIMDALAEIDGVLDRPQPGSASTSNPTTEPQSRPIVADSDEDDDDDAAPISPAREPSPPPPPRTPAAAPLIVLPSPHATVSPLLRAESARGHALLAHFRQRVRDLAARHRATVLLFNVTVGNAAGGTSEGVAEKARADERDAPPASAFAALGTIRPALGRAFASVLDLSILAARWRGPGARAGRWSVEVLFDARGERRGRWMLVDVKGEDVVRVGKA